MLSVVIPLRNEVENVAPVAAGLAVALRCEGVAFELILVDNGSSDGTGEAIDRLALPEARKAVEAERGFGRAVLRGLTEARGEVVGFMPGDGQVAPEDLVGLYRAMVARGAALAKVRRSRRQDGLARWLVSLACNLSFRLLFGLATWDVNGSPKLMRRDLYESLALRSQDWFLDAEIMIGCARRRVTYVEVPVTFRPRASGASNVRWSTAFEFLGNMGRALRG